MNKRELRVEDILDEEDLVLDIKHNSNTEFLPFISNEVVRQLINYATKTPFEDSVNVGHRYPFHACELLCSDNTAIMDRLLNEVTFTKEQWDEYYTKNTSMIHPQGFQIIQENDQETNMELKLEEEEVYKTPLIIYDNLDYFFSVLSPSDTFEPNFVLIGYFSQILSHLIEARGETVVYYLFSFQNNILERLLDLITYKSINDCLCQILTYIDDDNITLLNKYKSIMLKKILHKLDENSCIEIYDALCDLLCSSITNKQIQILLLSDVEIIRLFTHLVLKATSVDAHLISVMRIIIDINDLILRAFKKKVTNDHFNKTQDLFKLIGSSLSIKSDIIINKKYDDSINDILSEGNLQHILRPLINNAPIYFKCISSDQSDYQLSNKNTTYSMPQETLGLLRFTLLKYLRTLLDIIINSYANNVCPDILDCLILSFCKKGIFKNTIEFFFKYEFNNIYQLLFFEILSTVTNMYSPQILIQEYLINNDLLNRIISFIEGSIYFQYKSKRKTLSGCFAAVIQVSQIIVASKNKFVQEILKSNKQFCVLYEVLLNETNKQYNSEAVLLKLKQQQEARFNIISHIDTEEKHFTFSRFSLPELLDKEMTLFKEYKNGRNYTGRFAELCMKKNINGDNKEDDINGPMSPLDHDKSIHSKGKRTFKEILIENGINPSEIFMQSMIIIDDVKCKENITEESGHISNSDTKKDGNLENEKKKEREGKTASEKKPNKIDEHKTLETTNQNTKEDTEQRALSNS